MRTVQRGSVLSRREACYIVTRDAGRAECKATLTTSWLVGVEQRESPGGARALRYGR